VNTRLADKFVCELVWSVFSLKKLSATFCASETVTDAAFSCAVIAIAKIARGSRYFFIEADWCVRPKNKIFEEYQKTSTNIDLALNLNFEFYIVIMWCMDLDFKSDILLENSRTLLRPLSIDDMDDLLPVCEGEEQLVRYSPKPIYNRQLLSQFIDTAITDRQKELRYAFIIYDKQFKAYAGCTSFLNISNYHRYLEIGYTWLGRSFQKTGLNRNCEYLLLNYVFNTLDFKRVELRTDERNEASRTAIGKIGGKQEGILRSHMLMSDGYRRNTVCYGILQNEWQDALKGGAWSNEAI
jgi:RimJ/RimL family protein N-acetyltransferase